MASPKLALAADKTKNRWGFDTAFIESRFAVVLAYGVWCAMAVKFSVHVVR